jgi:hypothetical protein
MMDMGREAAVIIGVAIDDFHHSMVHIEKTLFFPAYCHQSLNKAKVY